MNASSASLPPVESGNLLDPLWNNLSASDQQRWQADIADFPPPPTLLEMLSGDLSLEKYDPQSLARRIAGDSVLSARVLGLANSAAYGLNSPITTIKRALVQLGFNLARSTILRYQLEASASHLTGIQTEELHSIQQAADQGALICYHWASLHRLPDPAAIATLCLLGRLGTFLLARRFPSEMSPYFGLLQEPQRMAYESNHFGVTVRSLTLQVAMAWSLPSSLQQGLYDLWNPLFSEDKDPARCIACASLCLGYAPPDKLDDLLKWLSPRANSRLRDNLLLSSATLPLPAMFDSEAYRREMSIVTEYASAA